EREVTEEGIFVAIAFLERGMDRIKQVERGDGEDPARFELLDLEPGAAATRVGGGASSQETAQLPEEAGPAVQSGEHGGVPRNLRKGTLRAPPRWGRAETNGQYEPGTGHQVPVRCANRS